MRKPTYVLVALVCVALTTSPVMAQSAQAAAEPGGNCGAQCLQCGLWFAEVAEVIANGNHWNYPYGCTDAACPNPCVAALDVVDVEELFAEAEEGDVTYVAAELWQNEGVTLNRERGLLRVLGCNDVVVAQMPLSEQTLAALERIDNSRLAMSVATQLTH